MNEPVLEMKGICLKFFDNVVLDHVDLSLDKGSVHALVGANGAGKTSLIKVLNGIYHADSGSIVLEGKPATIDNPKDAARLGIRFVHQELNVCPDLSVAENIFVGHLKTNTLGFYDAKATHRAAQELIDKVQIPIRAEAMVRDLRAAEKQIIEILKALTNESKILVLDEPTSSLSEKEKDVFFQLLNNLRKDGVSFIFISHFLEDVLQITDTITVLKDGKNNGTFKTREVTKDKIIQAMMGMSVVKRESKPQSNNQSVEPVLEVIGLTSSNKFEDVNFTLRPGSVLGVCGLLGAGKTELARAIYGLDNYDSGTIKLFGDVLVKHTPEQMMNKGVAFLPEERRVEGFIPLQSIRENISLSILKHLSNPLGFIRFKEQHELTESLSKRLTVKCTDLEQPVEELSGGNQQKVVIARCIASNPRVFILDEPTRGVDVYAKSEIYRVLADLANKGVGILVFSSELEELLEVCDDIIILKTGKIHSMVKPAEVSKGELLALIS